MNQDTRYLEFRRLIEQLEKISDEATAKRVQKISKRMKLPMTVILDRIEGSSMAAKARTLKVSRQTVHCWVNGVMRPNDKQAKLIANLTNFTVAEIRGKS